MTPIDAFFDRIFAVNLKRREDRRGQLVSMLESIGIPENRITWFDAYDKPTDSEGRPNANMGCTTSHAAILHVIAHERIPKTLILEDDCDVAFTSPARRDRVQPQRIFSEAIADLPSDWEMLYLARHFAEMPQKRISKNVIRIGRMLNTAAYGVTLDFARRAAPHIGGVGPIDNLFWPFHREGKCYCIDPTLFIQRPGFSDLHDKFEDYSGAMQDMNHIKALDSGTTYG